MVFGNRPRMVSPVVHALIHRSVSCVGEDEFPTPPPEQRSLNYTRRWPSIFTCHIYNPNVVYRLQPKNVFPLLSLLSSLAQLKTLAPSQKSTLVPSVISAGLTKPDTDDGWWFWTPKNKFLLHTCFIWHWWGDITMVTGTPHFPCPNLCLSSLSNCHLVLAHLYHHNSVTPCSSTIYSDTKGSMQQKMNVNRFLGNCAMLVLVPGRTC